MAQAFSVSSLEEALTSANGHPRDLGSNPCTEDAAERDLLVRDFQSGMAFIGGNTTSCPELSDLGMRKFVNAKTIRIGAEATAD